MAKIELPIHQRFWVSPDEAAALLNMSKRTFDDNHRFSEDFIRLHVEVQPNKFSRNKLMQYADGEYE